MELNSLALLNDANLITYLRMEGNSTDTKGITTCVDTAMTYGNQYGKFGQGAHFNGSSSHIQLQANASLNALGNNNSYTVCAWYSATTLKDQSITEKWAGSGNGTYPFVMRGPFDGGGGVPTISYAFYDGTNNPGTSYQGSKANDGNMHFVCIQRDRSVTKGRAFFDGVLVKEFSDTTNANISNTGVIEVGCRNGPGNYHTGNIDDYMIFNRVLTYSEIAMLYKLTAPTPIYLKN